MTRRTIYTDGHSHDLTYEEAVYLDSLDLIEAHPGAGEDGITHHDWKLAEGVDWSTILNELATFNNRL